MPKPENKFQISVTGQGNMAQIRIIGEIGWETNANSFRQQCDDLIAKGVKDVSLYINTPGGDCFDANEIVNILSKFPGTINGEGGALVASAGTYIAVHCHSFSMPSNGLFMVHKPNGTTRGKSSDIASFLKLITNLEKEYFDTYNNIATDKADFMKKWESGDNWMTAREAREAGFITDVKEKIGIDRQTAMMIAACGRAMPEYMDDENFNKPDNNMDKIVLTTAALAALKVGANADDSTLSAAIVALHDRAEKAEKALNELNKASATALVDKAVKEGRLSADKKDAFVTLAMNDFANAQSIIDAIPAKQTVGDKIKQGSKSEQPAGRDDWDYKRWLKDDPKGLNRMRVDNPDAFEELQADYKSKFL